MASARGAWPANVSFAQLIDAVVPEASRDRYVINLGANVTLKSSGAGKAIIDGERLSRLFISGGHLRLENVRCTGGR